MSPITTYDKVGAIKLTLIIVLAIILSELSTIPIHFIHL